MSKIFGLLITIGLFSSSFFSSAKIDNKEAYMYQYAEFMESVRNDFMVFQEEEWGQQDILFELFSKYYYEQYAGELDAFEKNRVRFYRVEYDGLRTLGTQPQIKKAETQR